MEIELDTDDGTPAVVIRITDVHTIRELAQVLTGMGLGPDGRIVDRGWFDDGNELSGMADRIEAGP